MKKFFSAVLAAAMALSMSAVSFAADYVIDEANTELQLIGPLVYDEDEKAMAVAADLNAIFTREDKQIPTYGKPIYYLILSQEASDTLSGGDLADGGTLAPVQKFKYIEKVKNKVEITDGGHLLRGLGIVKKYIDTTAQWNNGTSDVYYKIGNYIHNSSFTTPDGTKDGYYYFAEVKLADSDSLSETDVIGKLTVSRKADKKERIAKIDDVEFDVNYTVFHKNNWVNVEDQCLIKDSKSDFEWDTTYALKFDCDDEVELEFGTENNEGTFTVDVSGQGKVILRYNTTPVDTIVDANPGVKMDFINFNNVKFNRVGEFVYEMDDIAAAYKVVDGQLVAINGLELDGDSAAFNTRVLESYVFADAELVNPAPAVAVTAE